MWAPSVELPEDFVTGYSYAIATGSATLMSLYQRRCLDAVKEGRLPAHVPAGSPFAWPQAPAGDGAAASDVCSFVIDYGREGAAGARVVSSGALEQQRLGARAGGDAGQAQRRSRVA